MLAVFGGLLLFVALHCNISVLSFLFPVKVMEVLFFPTIYVMFVDPRYQVMIGSGTALMLTTHWTSLCFPSLTINGLSLGINETLWTSAVNEI